MNDPQATNKAAQPASIVAPTDVRPAIHGDHGAVPLGDMRVFSVEVRRFGFSIEDFRLDIKRLPRSLRIAAPAASFAVTVENLNTDRAATYLGGPGRTWVATFLVDLMSGTFGQP